MTPKQRAFLEILDAAGHRSLAPNEIGYEMNASPDPEVRLPSGAGKHWHGGTVSPGSMLLGVIGSLKRRGWIQWTGREDGLSGSAYRITKAGRTALTEERER